MSGVPVWLLVLGAIPAAWLAIALALRGFNRVAHFWVRAGQAIAVINYQLVPNDGESLIDKVDESLLIGRENQRALEDHLRAHGWGKDAK